MAIRKYLEEEVNMIVMLLSQISEVFFNIGII